MNQQTWADNWNSILRTVIFKDDELKRLMLIPESATIIDFRDKYFIQAGYTSESLTNEPVRIIYGHINVGDDENSECVSKMKLSFDIYVQSKQLYNATKDRLKRRSDLIAERLLFLLKKQRYLFGYRFYNPKENDLGTSTIGYTRKNITFSYMKVS